MKKHEPIDFYLKHSSQRCFLSSAPDRGHQFTRFWYSSMRSDHPIRKILQEELTGKNDPLARPDEQDLWIALGFIHRSLVSKILHELPQWLPIVRFGGFAAVAAMLWNQQDRSLFIAFNIAGWAAMYYWILQDQVKR